MTTPATYQQQLLAQAQQTYQRTPISDATVQAFLDTPRHEFVRRYRERATRQWREVNQENLDQHLATVYADNPLTLFGEDDDAVASTISQPSFVRRMLDLLQLEPGLKVLELGAGSGWNAALIARLVGTSGSVCSVEIIPELAQRASETIAELGIVNVRVIAGDGGDGYADGAPYDRMTFTAGTYDLPTPLYDQLKTGGLLLTVIKNEGGGDNLFLLRKTNDHFESIDSFPCGFVQMTGKYKIDTLDPISVEQLPGWEQLRHQEVRRRPFWWGGKGREWFMWQTVGIRSFLGIVEPSFRTFKIGALPVASYFGLWDETNTSLVLAMDDQLISYGNTVATERLGQLVHQWVDLGMPTASSFSLRVYKNDAPVVPSSGQWLVKRSESQFLWELKP